MDPIRWPPAEVLDQLGSSLPTRCPAPLFAALYAVLTSPKLAYSAKSLGRLERLLAKSVSLAFDLRTVEHAMPQIKERLGELHSSKIFVLFFGDWIDLPFDLPSNYPPKNTIYPQKMIKFEHQFHQG